MAEAKQGVVKESAGGVLERLFRIRERKSSPQIEVIAGITSFLAAAYLIVLIPLLLSGGGIDRGAATTATIIVFVFGCLFMGLYGNLPFLVGPGIGGSVIVGTTLAQTEQVPWQIGVGIAFWSGLLFLVMTLFGAREVITRMVPPQIKLALGAAIGLFIAVLGFRNAGLIAVNVKGNALALGNFTSPGAMVALFGLLVGIALHARKIPGAILWAILAATALGYGLGVTKLPSSPIGLPHSIDKVAGHIDIWGALSITYFPYLFAFFAAEFFSTMGTTLAVGGKAGLVDEHGNMENINRPFVVDSTAAMLGPIIGIPAATALVESAAGVESGGRTGLTAIAAAGMFFLMLLFTPVAMMIPKEATAPALILVGVSMFGAIRKVDLDNFTDGLAALFMVLLTLISNSFGTGIAGGLLFYVVIKLVSGQHREVPLGMYLMTIPLAYYFWTVVGNH